MNNVIKASELFGAAIPAAFFGLMYAASEHEYKACNNSPYRTVQWAEGSNYSFNVSECDYQKNKDNYK